MSSTATKDAPKLKASKGFGLAGELQLLLVQHPKCPRRANPFVKAVYKHADTLLAALRLAED